MLCFMWLMAWKHFWTVLLGGRRTCRHACAREAGHLGPHLDADFLRGIKEGVAAMKRGEVTPWEDVERELFPEHSGNGSRG